MLSKHTGKHIIVKTEEEEITKVWCCIFVVSFEEMLNPGVISEDTPREGGLHRTIQGGTIQTIH